MTGWREEIMNEKVVPSEWENFILLSNSVKCIVWRKKLSSLIHTQTALNFTFIPEFSAFTWLRAISLNSNLFAPSGLQITDHLKKYLAENLGKCYLCKQDPTAPIIQFYRPSHGYVWAANKGLIT